MGGLNTLNRSQQWAAHCLEILNGRDDGDGDLMKKTIFPMSCGVEIRVIDRNTIALDQEGEADATVWIPVDRVQDVVRALVEFAELARGA